MFSMFVPKAMARIKICQELKQKIISDFKDGLKQKEICDKYAMSKSTISIIIKKYRQKGTVATLHLGGRPRKTTQTQDDLIAKELREYPNQTPHNVIHNLKLEISTRTINRRAKELGRVFNFGCYRPLKKSLLTKKNSEARINFAREHLSWPRENWSTVIFSTFNLSNHNGISLVRRPQQERIELKYAEQPINYSEDKVTMWGCFAPQEEENNQTGFCYKNILNNVLYTYMEENMIMMWSQQHVNDPQNTSTFINEWLATNGNSVLEWPDQSPDLNPIDYLWEIIDQKLRTQYYPHKQDLVNGVIFAWQQISLETINVLIDSMPQRCIAVMKNNGYGNKL